MSKLAGKLSNVAPEPPERVRKGPKGSCQGTYPADLEDWAEVERIRHEPDGSWAEAQRIVDEVHGVTRRVPIDRFRYHWRRKCSCWDEKDRL